jgi:hypothetical protein
LLTLGFFAATRKCLAEYGEYSFAIDEENSVEGGSSSVDCAVLVNGGGTALCEAKSPSFMKKVGELLPPYGIELKWVRGQSLVPKILTKVSMLFPVSYNVSFKRKCVGRIVFGSETDGMAVSYLPQLLDRVPSCEA